MTVSGGGGGVIHDNIDKSYGAKLENLKLLKKWFLFYLTLCRLCGVGQSGPGIWVPVTVTEEKMGARGQTPGYR